MSTDTAEWVDLGVALWAKGIDGMQAESLFRACGPEGGRIDPLYGPQVRKDVLERIQRERLEYQAKLDAWDAEKKAVAQGRREHIDAARAKARDAELRRRRSILSGGRRINRSPAEESQISQAMSDAGEAAAAEWDRKHPPLTLERFEKTYKP